MPSTTDRITKSRAVLACCAAAAMSPRFLEPFALMAKTNAGIPSGQAQKMIDMIDGISQSKTLGASVAAAAIGGGTAGYAGGGSTAPGRGRVSFVHESPVQ